MTTLGDGASGAAGEEGCTSGSRWGPQHVAAGATSLLTGARGPSALGVARGEVLARPLPDVPGHVDQAVAVRGELADRGGALVAVEQVVLHGEVALPGVGHHPSPRGELVSPGEHGAVETAAGRELPLGLGRQLLAGPGGVRQRVGVRHVRDGVQVAAVQGAVRPFGMPPLRRRRPGPPGPEVVQADATARRGEDERARHQLLGIRVREVQCVGGDLRDRDVAGRLHEPSELRHGHRVLVDPEAVDPDRVDGSLLGIEVLGAHRELPTGDPDHVLRGPCTRPRSLHHVPPPRKSAATLVTGSPSLGEASECGLTQSGGSGRPTLEDVDGRRKSRSGAHARALRGADDPAAGCRLRGAEADRPRR